MKVVILYKPRSEYARQVETYVRDYQDSHESRVELIDYDSRDGSAIASLYDVVQSPAILVTAIDGQLLRSWEGPELPLMDEIAAYAYS